MKSRFTGIISENNLCVLCTCKNNIPNSSLMLYISSDTCTKIYVLTRKTGAKYLNILDNPHVSLLIDTRDSINNKTNQIESLTIYGEAYIIEDKDTSERLINQLVQKHDRLINLASNVDVCVVEISICSVMLLDGVDKSHYISLSDNLCNTAQKNE